MPWDEALIQAVVSHDKEKAGHVASQKFEAPSATEQAPPPKKRGFFAALRRS